MRRESWILNGKKQSESRTASGKTRCRFHVIRLKGIFYDFIQMDGIDLVFGERIAE